MARTLLGTASVPVSLGLARIAHARGHHKEAVDHCNSVLGSAGGVHSRNIQVWCDDECW